MVEIKHARWTPIDMWLHLESLMKIKWQILCDVVKSERFIFDQTDVT